MVPLTFRVMLENSLMPIASFMLLFEAFYLSILFELVEKSLFGKSINSILVKYIYPNNFFEEQYIYIYIKSVHE